MANSGMRKMTSLAVLWRHESCRMRHDTEGLLYQTCVVPVLADTLKCTEYLPIGRYCPICRNSHSQAAAQLQGNIEARIRASLRQESQE